MTIKSLGGIFGRNPTFNNVDVEGNLDVQGNLDVTGTAKVNNFIAGATSTPQANVEIKDATGGELRLSTSEPSMVVNDVAGKITWNAPDEGSGTQANIVAGEISLIATDFWDVTRYTPSAIVFKTCPLNGPEIVEAARFNSSGNLAFPSGQGIDFSATSGTGTSELFDDYEEGVHTATLTPETSGTITLVSAVDTIAYTKIGRLVTVTGLLQITSVGSPVGGYVKLSLPFQISDITEYSERVGGAITYYNTTAYSVIPLVGLGGVSEVRVYVDASTLAANHTFNVSFSYTTG
jgi:hypothetical protein